MKNKTMKKIKAIYILEMGWIYEREQYAFGTEERFHENGEIKLAYTEEGEPMHFIQKIDDYSEYTIYPAKNVLAVKYYQSNG